MKGYQEADEALSAAIEELSEEIEVRQERLRALEEREEEHAHTDEELVAFMTADRGGRTAELVELVGMAEEIDLEEKRGALVESRVREIALGADREPVNRRERRHLEQVRRRLVR